MPEEEARKKILESQLKHEVLDDSVDLTEIAKKTKMYSGSDLKNVCVSAAIARVKESIVASRDPSNFGQVIENIEDWSEYLGKSSAADEIVKMMSLKNEHFEIGLKECPPSLVEETETLVELRKWDKQYGDGAAAGRNKKTGYGFQLP